MKKPTMMILTAVMLLVSMIQVSYLIDSFPGFHSDADCSYCHNEPATAYNSSFMNSQITLDGVADEEFWVGPPWFREMRIPVASEGGDEEIFVTLIFAQNSTHLFIYVTWKDVQVNGTDSVRYGDGDGFAIMWNTDPSIDMPENYFGGMESVVPGHVIDNWIWKPTAAMDVVAAAVNTTNSEKALMTATTTDTAFDDGGWDDALDTTQDVKAAGTWGYQSSRSRTNYLLEFSRPLVTGDSGDAQFDKIGYYEFAIAIYNGSSGASHLISFEHMVFIYGACVSDCDIPFVVTEIHETTQNVTITEISTEESTPIPFIPIMLSIFTMMIVTVYFRRKT